MSLEKLCASQNSIDMSTEAYNHLTCAAHQLATHFNCTVRDEWLNKDDAA